MAPIGILWGTARQPQSKTIRSVAALNGLELELSVWNFSKKPAEYTSHFPYGKIPAFHGADGFKLIEGVTIARYLCSLGTKVNLLGSNAKEVALVDQWIHFAELEIGAAVHDIMGIIYGFAGSFNREALDKQTERLNRGLTYIESYLATCPSGYLVSDSVTLADFVLASIAHGASFAALGAAERAKYPAIFAHYAKVTEDDRVKEFWGKEGFTEVAVSEPRSFTQSS